MRLADLLAGLSLVSDLGFPQSPEEAMRRCVIAAALARRMGLDVREARRRAGADANAGIRDQRPATTESARGSAPPS